MAVNRGIVVNDYLETSDPAIYAVGECTEHRGQTFGLVAPLYEQGRVLARVLTGDRSEAFTGAAPAARLKIAGVEIFSAGSIDETTPGVEVLRLEDPAAGVYKKILLKDGRLHGVILVGDTSDETAYTEWLRKGTDLSGMRKQVLFPPHDPDPGLEVAEMADNDIVCGCNGVRKGAIIAAIHQHGIRTLVELKKTHQSSHRMRQLPNHCAASC